MPVRRIGFFALVFPALLFSQAASTPDPLSRIRSSRGSVPENVWVTDSMAKVQPGTLPGTGRVAELFAARNEYESFQIHVRSGDAAMQLTVSVSDLISGESRISSAANIALYREAYLNVTTVSDLNGISGQVPDALIPDVDPYFHETRNGFPVAVPPHETRSIWADVFVPLKTPPGLYEATATVFDSGRTLARVPLRLRVWNFDLPSTASLKSAFGMGFPAFCYAAYGSFEACAKYPGGNGNPQRGLDFMHAAIASFFLDHRVTISEAVSKPTYASGQWQYFDQIYGPLLAGQAPTQLPGAKLTTLEYPDGKGENLPDLEDYASHFLSQGWPRLFIYNCDEPPAGCPWQSILTIGAEAHASTPPVSSLVTTSIDRASGNGVLDAIDILVPVVDAMHPRGGLSQRGDYDGWLMQPGKQLWWYQSCDEHESCDDGLPGPVSSTWPSYMADASPVRNRIFQWLAYFYQIQGELYYEVDNWGDNPWDHLYFAGGNGDGELYYPGTAAAIGGSTPIPVASMRLKLIREGMEDYEYMAALARAGQASTVASILSSVVTNTYTFTNNPAALMAARRQMGAELDRLGGQSRAAGGRN